MYGVLMSSERSSVAETRARLIDVGCEMVSEFGLEQGLRGITLSDAIERSKVPRTSAYRAFAHDELDPQQSFQVTVLLESVDRMVTDTSMVAIVFAQLGGSNYDNTPEGQAAEMRELIRRWSAAALESNLENSRLRTLEAISQVTGLSLSPDPAVLEALTASFEKSHAELRPLYEFTVERYGLRFRPGFDSAYLTSMLRSIAGSAITEWTMQPATRDRQRPTGLHGAMQSWTFTGVIAEALALLVLEEDPDATVISADLSSWIRST